MPIFDIFSKREKKRRSEYPDVYQYETIPKELRVQVVLIMKDIFDQLYSKTAETETYKFIHETLCRGYGESPLGQSNNVNFPAEDINYRDIVVKFLLDTDDAERVIDVIGLFFQHIKPSILPKATGDSNSPTAQKSYIQLLLYSIRKKSEYAKAIAQLNRCFQEHGIGYQYVSNRIICIDSQFLHSEVVKPALSMLSDPMYEGANAEFLSAHDHYRAKRYDDCMNDCLKAFESCIIAICEARGWDYDNRDTIKPLIDIIFDNELIPNFMDSHFTGLRKAVDVRKGLRTALESGVPTLRNNLSGHGDGTKEAPVPEYIAAYTLHLTASNLLFLAKANEAMK